ncbi:hypothetical protein A2U01_0060217, partial [Trifolium medium]|nr:hypothetical protein [Trifolium medium]
EEEREQGVEDFWGIVACREEFAFGGSM